MTLTRAFRHLGLAPYGDSLLTAAAATWIAIARLQLLLLSFFVAYGFSSAVFYFSSAPFKSAVAVAAGSCAFLLAWSVGALLLTYDSTAISDSRQLRVGRVRRFGALFSYTLLLAMLAILATPFVARLVPGFTVQSFAVALILALVITKAFQPRAVSVYYAEELQDAYGQYLHGAFNALLPESDRRSLSPLRFHEWYATTYQARFTEEMLRHEMQVAMRTRELEDFARRHRLEAEEFSRHQIHALQDAVGDALDATRRAGRTNG
jgi:hypothetical protein